MMADRASHGFMAVDSQDDPRRWIIALDRLRQEPFFRAYKERVIEHLKPTCGRVYLDIGAGTGDDARAVADSVDAIAVGLDLSREMMREAKCRGLNAAIVGDAARMPFADRSFDGCWADRVFKHLIDPDRTLGEMVRVTKPKGRLVVIEADYGSQVLEFPDKQLAEQVLRFRTDSGLQKGAIARSVPGMFSSMGLAEIEVEASTLVVRDPEAVDNVMGLRTWASSACSAGYLSKDDVRRWEKLFDENVAAGRFIYALTFILTAGTNN